MRIKSMNRRAVVLGAGAGIASELLPENSPVPRPFPASPSG